MIPTPRNGGALSADKWSRESPSELDMVTSLSDDLVVLKCQGHFVNNQVRCNSLIYRLKLTKKNNNDIMLIVIRVL